MPMTKPQREMAIPDLRLSLSRQHPYMARNLITRLLTAAERLAAQHHDENYHECLVVHLEDNSIMVRDDDGNAQLLMRNALRPEPTANALVEALKTLRVPTRLKTTKIVHCPVCECYHPADWNGDCREDGNRFPPPNNSDDEADYFTNGDPGLEVILAGEDPEDG